jgi:exosortase
MDWLILAGSAGDETSWARDVPRHLLPLPGTTLLESLLAHMHSASSGAGTCTICVNGHTEWITPCAERFQSATFEVGVLEDSLPLGTAGCLKSCQDRLNGNTVFVTGGSVWFEDDPRWMLEQHRTQGNALTVFCTVDSNLSNGKQRTVLSPAGIYCCEPDVLDHIPEVGYQDLKEQLVPALRHAGLRVGAVSLRRPACQVSDWRSYMHVLHRILSTGQFPLGGYDEIAPGIWRGRDVSIAEDARIVGPALLGHQSRIEPGAVVVGPAMLGDRAQVGAGSWLIRVIAPEDSRSPAGMSLTDQFVPELRLGALPLAEGPGTGPLKPRTEARSPHLGPENPKGSRVGSPAAAKWLSVAAIVATFAWAFWDTLGGLWHVWRTDGDYSAGQIVPLAAAYMLAARRNRLKRLKLRFAPLGLAIFGAGFAMNLFGAYYLYSSLENLGMGICLNGLVLMLVGWRGYRRIWYPMVFLFLTLPLPHRFHDLILLPLQGIGARISASILEIVGIPAVRAGHVLEVAGHRIAVAEACSGLRMAVAFLIVTAVFAYFIRRPRWQKIIVVLSSLPIAVLCNVGRIVVAACLYTAGHGWAARGAFHDMTGLLMVPAALALVWLELWILSCVVMHTPSAPKAVTALVDQMDRRVAGAKGSANSPA